MLGCEVQEGFEIWVFRSRKVPRFELSGPGRFQGLGCEAQEGFKVWLDRTMTDPALAMVLLQRQGGSGTPGLLMALPTQRLGKKLCGKLKVDVSTKLGGFSLPLSGITLENRLERVVLCHPQHLQPKKGFDSTYRPKWQLHHRHVTQTGFIFETIIQQWIKMVKILILRGELRAVKGFWVRQFSFWVRLSSFSRCSSPGCPSCPFRAVAQTSTGSAAARRDNSWVKSMEALAR